MKEYKQKRLAEYCEKFGLCQQKGSCQCAKELKFISETIEQAIAEDRERVRERFIIIYRNGIIDGKQGTNCEDVVIKEALSSLDKPLTDK